MSAASILAIGVLVAALGLMLARFAQRQRPTVARVFLACGSGGAAGLGLGMVVACMLGGFVGLTPGTPENLWALSLAMGCLGLILGAMGGIVWGQRMDLIQK